MQNDSWKGSSFPSGDGTDARTCGLLWSALTTTPNESEVECLETHARVENRLNADPLRLQLITSDDSEKNGISKNVTQSIKRKVEKIGAAKPEEDHAANHDEFQASDT